MTNQPLHDLEAEERRFQPAEGRAPASYDFYAELCALENLQQAYAHLKENGREHGIDPLTFETIEAEGVEAFLKQLSDDLQTRTYQPIVDNVVERAEVLALRDRVVQVALKHLLESAFPPAFPSDPDAEKTIKWLAGNIDKGLSRVYAVNLNENKNDKGYARLVERVSQQIGDPQLIALLKEVLAASAQPDHPFQGFLAPLLADIACEDIDHILQQAKTLGREGNFLHVQCTRVTNQLIVLSDREPRYEWIMPAVQKRLREELSNLHYEPVAVETQSVDLMGGDPLYVLGFELRLVTERGGEERVHYQRIEEPTHGQVESVLPRRHLRERYRFLRLVGRYMNGTARLLGWQFVRDTCRKVNSIQVGWRHLPITLFPVLLFLFGWRSPVAWFCLASIFVCNWRWTFYLAGQGGGWARQRWLDVVLLACGIAALACLFPWLSDLYASRSHEVAAPSPLPPGFYLGQYHADPWWDSEPASRVPYGLYLPPHFQEAKGPSPLIVYLHGHGQGSKQGIFQTGLPAVLASRLGKEKPNEQFGFAVFCPIDPQGQWLPGSHEVEGAIKALAHVMERHHIDPGQIYLTGMQSGGDGVWRLAESYPDKWAALAPVHSTYQPNVQKVQHIPVWIFDAVKNKRASMQQQEILLPELQKVQADVHYTTVPNKGISMEREVYRSQELYDWLASKKKG